jgi:endonuclease G
MTNRHVASIFASGLGTRSLSFKPGLRAGIDFLRELDRPTGPTLAVKKVVMVHPYWDMALLAVDGLPQPAEPLHLSVRDFSADDMIEVAAIGYPAFDTRNDPEVQNDLFRRVFGVKRLQPGTLGGRVETASFGKLVAAMRHNCSTLGGNSGSALVDIATGEVVALHFGGLYKRINYGVPACELAKDQRVIDAGVVFKGERPVVGEPEWSEWWNLADEATVSDVRRDDAAPQRRADQLPAATASGIKATLTNGSLQVVAPLVVTISLGTAAKAVEVRTAKETEAEADLAIERLVMPFHDEDYSTRRGYNRRFLEVEVPMPEPADPAVVAKTKSGGAVLHYQNFSIVTHAKRRMALFTASNVTAEARLKKPEPGRSYTRKGLSGLGDSDQERWFPDPRMSDEFQLPDVFYTRDDGAFDKGHVVRREDVAWGRTYDTLRRANGDTYHVTNCSPQVAGFNRSTLGENNWGDLEDHVLKGAAQERYCQFAGPILDPNDEVFVGAAGGRARLKIKIPSRYWKVLVVPTQDGIASYGFVLEQDLSDVPFEEFVVPANFKRFMEPLRDLERLAGIKFPDVVLDADQFDTDEGIDVAFNAGVARRPHAHVDHEKARVVPYL